MNDLPALLDEFYREKLSSLERHVAAARVIGQYDANNTYQYIINREETQLSWIGRAIVDLGGQIGPAAPTPARDISGRAQDAAPRVMAEDARDAQAFVERWTSRVDAMTNARHRGMLRVVLGETLEQKRFFEQALSGDMNLLGRRDAAAGARVGTVMSTRWIE